MLIFFLILLEINFEVKGRTPYRRLSVLHISLVESAFVWL